MRASRRGTVAAGTVFFLIAAVVIGGMTWATSLQLHLAEREALDRHQARLREALVRMEGHIKELLIPEIAREPTDYVTYHVEEAKTAWTADGQRRNVEKVLKKSTIATSGPLYEWIDLYFHVREDGDAAADGVGWWSPQITGERQPSPRALRTMDWLRRTTTVVALAERVAQVRADVHEVLAGAGRQQEHLVQMMQTVGASGYGNRLPATDFQRRRERNIAAQMRYLPSAKCIADKGIDTNTNRDQDLFVCSPPMSFGLTADPMAVFWLKGEDDETPRLLFVRTGFEDTKLFYQGFVADWQRLKPELIDLVREDLYPLADLEPVLDEPDDALATDVTKMDVIPARLIGPDVEDTGVALARASVAKVLIVAWPVALTVLGLAGLAASNLVALTNRRLQFAYAVTHELRTPLTTFRLYADMLAAGLVPAEAKQDYLDTLNREAVRLSGIVQGVLEYARLENQKVKLNLVETDATALLDRLDETLETSCRRDGVRTEARSDLTDDHCMRTDVELVTQIAGVLVDNAARHARTSPEPAVQVRLSSHNGALSVHVLDSGPGIDRRDARSIFKPFRRGKAAKTAAQRGIGLGLALARSWATLLGGRLELVSRRDPEYGGAHFCLTIPSRIRD